MAQYAVRVTRTVEEFVWVDVEADCQEYAEDAAVEAAVELSDDQWETFDCSISPATTVKVSE